MERLRATWRRLRAGAFLAGGGGRRAGRALDGSRALVLCYHRVLPRAEAERLDVEPGMFVTPDTFARHLEWLAARFSILPLGELASRLAEGRALPRGACAISFDDGWRDNHQHAWPALRAAGVPATIFLVTSRVGTTGAFWPDEVCRRLRGLPRAERDALVGAIAGVQAGPGAEAALLRHLKALDEPDRERALERLARATPAPPDRGRELLSWDEVEEMARGGVDFESHGASHAILTGLPAERVQAELRGAQEALAARGLGRGRLLAYPSGAFDATVVDAARACGTRAAFTTDPGLASGAGSHLTLPRILLHQDVSATAAELLYRVARPGAAG